MSVGLHRENVRRKIILGHVVAVGSEIRTARVFAESEVLNFIVTYLSSLILINKKHH